MTSTAIALGYDNTKNALTPDKLAVRVLAGWLVGGVALTVLLGQTVGAAGGFPSAIITFIVAVVVPAIISNRDYSTCMKAIRIENLLEYARNTGAVEILVLPKHRPIFISETGERDRGGKQTINAKTLGVQTSLRLNVFEHASAVDVLALVPTNKGTKPLAIGNSDGNYSFYVAEGATGIRIALN